MKLNNKKMLAGILLLALCVSLTACQKPSRDSDENGTNNSQTVTGAQPEASEKEANAAEGTAAPTEKSVLETSGVKAAYQKSDVIKAAELIVRGKILSKNSEEMTNPDGTRKDENGNAYENCLVTDYTVEVYDVYKGEWSEQTVHVKTFTGYGLSPDLILYGEDDKTVLADPVDRLELEVGGECILCLTQIENVFPDRSGYRVQYGNHGYLKADGNGNYQNSGVGKPFSLSADTAAQEIADIMADAN